MTENVHSHPPFCADVKKGTFFTSAPSVDGSPISDGSAPFLTAVQSFDGSAQIAVLPHGSIICPRFPVLFPGKGHAVDFVSNTGKVRLHKLCCADDSK